VCSLTSSEEGQDHFWIQKYILLFTAGEIKTKVAGLKSVCKCGWPGWWMVADLADLEWHYVITYFPLPLQFILILRY